MLKILGLINLVLSLTKITRNNLHDIVTNNSFRINNTKLNLALRLTKTTKLIINVLEKKTTSNLLMTNNYLLKSNNVTNTIDFINDTTTINFTNIDFFISNIATTVSSIAISNFAASPDSEYEKTMELIQELFADDCVFRPTPENYLMIAAFCIIFCLSVIGNSIVVVVIVQVTLLLNFFGYKFKNNL